MKVSWLILTYNRCEKVQRAVTHNLSFAGEAWDELVWVDNGSTDGVRDFMAGVDPDVRVLNETNLGVAVGYNLAMRHSTCDFMVITGCDMLMPKGWLKTFKDYFRAIPNTGVATMYSGPLSWIGERARKGNGHGDWKHEVINGKPITHGMPMGRRMYSRALLEKTGYLREDFGLYGWEDVEWAHRAERVCDELGLLYYNIPDMIPEHLGTEGIKRHDGKDESAYHAFKQRETNDPAKAKLMAWCKDNNYPYYNPYTGVTGA